MIDDYQLIFRCISTNVLISRQFVIKINLRIIEIGRQKIEYDFFYLFVIESRAFCYKTNDCDEI